MGSSLTRRRTQQTCPALYAAGENGLQEGLREIEAIRDSASDVDVRPGAEGWTDLAHALDLRAGLAVAEATLRGAIERREARGAHNRTDYPDLDPRSK